MCQDCHHLLREEGVSARAFVQLVQEVRRTGLACQSVEEDVQLAMFEGLQLDQLDPAPEWTAGVRLLTELAEQRPGLQLFRTVGACDHKLRVFCVGWVLPNQEMKQLKRGVVGPVKVVEYEDQ